MALGTTIPHAMCSTSEIIQFNSRSEVGRNDNRSACNGSRLCAGVIVCSQTSSLSQTIGRAEGSPSASPIFCTLGKAVSGSAHNTINCALQHNGFQLVLHHLASLCSRRGSGECFVHTALL